MSTKTKPNITTASGTTVTYIGQGSRKFYRIMVIEDIEVRQWGRIGTDGQFSSTQHSGKRAAEASAEKQIQAKMRKGYGSRIDLTFSFDTNLLSQPRREHMLAAAYEATEARAFNFEHGNDDSAGLMGQVPDIPQAPSETMQQVADRALGVVTLAATGVEEASVEYAKLRDDFKEVTEQYERAIGLLETIEAML